jgi:uncharacterized membrane protein YgdD (TMEM256/DUF423 family)
MTASRIHLAIACVFGGCGVGLWAWATHAGQPSAAIAAQMLLIHAAAIIGLTAARKRGLLPGRGGIFLVSVLAFGVLLFAGDLAVRAIGGQHLFPMASPIGGVLMIAAWLGLAVAPFMQRWA